MRKYWRVFVITIKQYFVYRLSFVLWRFRMFINLFIVFFLWNAVFLKNQHISYYNKTALLSYILFVNIISTLVLGTRTSDVATQINDGTIMNYLVKPIKLFRYLATEDIADKFLNLGFVIFEVILILRFTGSAIFFPRNILLGSIFLLNGICISFFINLMLSFIAFWTTETWGPRFLYLMLVGFVAGSFFPLDLLPKPIYQMLLFSPFPYLFYLPAKIFLGVSGKQLIPYYFISLSWVLIFWRLTSLMWAKGNKSFSFWGR